MNQESSRNPKHRPAAGKSRKTPCRRNSAKTVIRQSCNGCFARKIPCKKANCCQTNWYAESKTCCQKTGQQIQPQNAPFPSHLQSQQPERRLQTCRQRNPFPPTPPPPDPRERVIYESEADAALCNKPPTGTPEYPYYNDALQAEKPKRFPTLRKAFSILCTTLVSPVPDLYHHRNDCGNGHDGLCYEFPR